ncbi:MAG TPA: (d)CMP kinase [Tepidisphaeraceae bacterium]|nr:(d)CMP kinase [Tepidisphaeraceae bacterium]
MIITIDGPAGTGKSTVSRAVAERLKLNFLDTGAMYRAIGLEAVRRGVDLADGKALALMAQGCRIEFDWLQSPPEVMLNGERVGQLVRSGQVSSAASQVAVVPAIRQLMVEQQQRIGRERPNLVTEGRDQGSVVFPHAELKFYLDATPEERARRRVEQLRAQGVTVDLQETLREIKARDHRDSTRATGPLAVPNGAEVIDTTHLTEQQVIELIVSRAEERGSVGC